MAGSIAGSASSMGWTIVGSMESESWSDVEAVHAHNSETDFADAASELHSSVQSFDLVEDAAAMAPSVIDSEPTNQPSSKVTDWVEQQALEDRAPNTSDAAPFPVTGIKESSSGILGSRRYNIFTLLQIRESSTLANVELRIHPAALQEQIFKPPTCLPFTRTQRRSRGLSEVSLTSLHSIPVDEEVIYRKSRPARQPIAPPLNFNEALQLSFVNRFPRRQPISPPGSALAQQHDGFARFLKEHASPPHQRVTAGGRIVPAAGPPPVFNVDALRAPTLGFGTQEPSATPQGTRKGSVTDDKFRQTVTAAADRALSNTSENVALGNEQSSQAQQPKMGDQADGFKMNQAIGHQLQVASTLQLPAGCNPLMLADGSNVIFQNGVPYRVYWNGFKAVSEPVTFPFAAVPGPTTTNLQATGFAPQYSIANPYANSAILPLVQSNPGTGQDVQSRVSDQQLPDHALDRMQETLRYELKKLDKHIALRSHMFSALEHSNYVAQRKHLVGQMDNIRVSRRSGNRASSNNMAGYQGNLSTIVNAPAHSYNTTHQPRMQANPTSQDTGIMGIPTKFDAQGLATGPPWNALVNGAIKTASVTVSVAESQQRTPPPKKGPGASSILSPDAPPFVPSSMRGTTARKVESCFSDDQFPNQSANVAEDSSVTAAGFVHRDPLITTKTQKSVTISSATNDDQTTYQDSSKALQSRGRSRMSGSGSAMYDLVPLVHQADIAYVENRSLNPMHGPKLYCSTVTEFQEVIRRVREQARLYGCEGGQSKDPEFDAEQDIRWAMADYSPIPLPKKLPDHIANPRPWNWNDSAFNVYADRSNLKSGKSTGPTTDVGNVQSRIEGLEISSGMKEPGLGQPAQNMGIRDMSQHTSCPAIHTDTKPSQNTDPTVMVSESKQPKPLATPRTVLGELSPNKPAAATTIESSNGNRNVDVARSSPEIVDDDNAETWRRIMREKFAGFEDESNAPLPFILEVENEDDSLSEQQRPRVNANNDAKPLSGFVATIQSEGDAGATIPTEQKHPAFPKVHSIVGRKSASEWTKEDQDAVDAAYGDPFKRPPTPEGWSDIPLPPDILSKMPFKLEDWQKSPPRDPHVHFPDGQYYGSSTAKVEATGASSLGSKPLGYNEYKPISIPTGSMSHGPPTFLRELLKTPQFSANSPSQHSSTVPVASRQVSFKEASSLSVNKENLRSSMRSSSQASYTANQHFGLGNGYYLSQTGPVSKAQSLVAASSHHAQGYLPQYKGLGRTQSSDYNVRYQMPQPYSNIQGGYLRNPRAGLASYSSRRYPPQYDGGADSPPHHPKDNSDAANGTDTKKGTEISPQAFQVDNGKLPAGHSYAVDRLFQTIREAERKEIDAHDQKAAKRT